MNNNLAFLIFNFIGLQITWAACAYGATHGNSNLGMYIGAAYLILHFSLSRFRLRDLKIMLILGAFGIFIDSILSHLNIISFTEIPAKILPLPAWLIALWLVFSLMVPYSLYWLRKNLFVAAMAGAIGGCFSYFLGHKLGALNLGDPLWLSSAVYFIFWGAFFPVALLVTQYFTNKEQSSQLKN